MFEGHKQSRPLNPNHYIIRKKEELQGPKMRERKTFSLFLLAPKMGAARYDRDQKLISIINRGKGGECCMPHAHSLVTNRLS